MEKEADSSTVQGEERKRGLSILSIFEKEVFFDFCPIVYLLVHVWIPPPFQNP